MFATAVALLWANLAVNSYHWVWETTLSVGVGPLTFQEDVRHLINDLLMAVFFYVVALEVKRELIFGTLRDRRSAAVPAAAALGTMVGAALTYLAVNVIRDGNLHGWAIPIATDIAFAVGVLGLAGRRAPRELRAFMLTLAVVDDIGTIAVIALFFASGISLAWLGVAVTLVFAIFLAQRAGVRSFVAYGPLAAGLWLAVFESGVHATIAGVILGFMTPAILGRQAAKKSGAVDDETFDQRADGDPVASAHLSPSDERRSPLRRMERFLHPWTAYVILPLFALANAGVAVSAAELVESLTAPIGLGIFLGLVVGAPLVGFAFAWAIAESGLGRLPERLDWPAIAGVAPLKGIGFTVAIFIAALAFDSQADQDEAKLSILAGSAVSALIGLAVLHARAALLNRRVRNADRPLGSGLP
jgi:NhaA family Na+:H+ antiporter